MEKSKNTPHTGQPSQPGQPERSEAERTIPQEDLDLIFEVGLEMHMAPREIWEFVNESDIATELADFSNTRNAMREKLESFLPVDETKKDSISQTERRFKKDRIRILIEAYQRKSLLSQS